MGLRDPRFDAYIARSADFAKPILSHLREVVHAACPDVEETLKWSMPHFTYNGLLCHMAAFTQHCAFGFWKGDLLVDPNSGSAEKAMGQFGRITRIADLPSKKVLGGLVKAAMQLNEAGVKAPARAKAPAKGPPVAPDYFLTALKKNKKAQKTYDAFTPGKQREYIDWVTEAKSEATRVRRLQTAIEWMAEGKTRNWKYVNC